MSHGWAGLPGRESPAGAADRPLGNSVGAIGWPAGGVAGSRWRRRLGWGPAFARPPTRVTDPEHLTREVRRRPAPFGASRSPGHDSYLVDSASSHMLVSKIKPCMSKYKQSIR